MAAVAAEVPAEPPSSGVRNPSVGSACSRRRRCDPRRSSRRIAAASCNGRAKIHPSGLRSVSSPTMRMARLERSECNWYPQRSSLTCPGEELGGGGKARAGLGRGWVGFGREGQWPIYYWISFGRNITPTAQVSVSGGGPYPRTAFVSATAWTARQPCNRLSTSAHAKH